MAAVDFLHHDNPSTWAGVEPATLGTEGQRQTNDATQPTYTSTYTHRFPLQLGDGYDWSKHQGLEKDLSEMGKRNYRLNFVGNDDGGLGERKFV
ncbi:hypothetical protein TNCV_3025091 [Trichonephila clavipes]|nr:hypothetical protein TNCV_3025091 [Trichonephila clavipes]